MHVDGRDVALDDWQWVYGTEGDGDDAPERPYGWAVFWKGEEWDGHLHRISWSDFTASFVSPTKE